LAKNIRLSYFTAKCFTDDMGNERFSRPTTTSAFGSHNTLNVIPEYDELTMALAVILAAMAFAGIRRQHQRKAL